MHGSHPLLRLTRGTERRQRSRSRIGDRCGRSGTLAVQRDILQQHPGLNLSSWVLNYCPAVGQWQSTMHHTETGRPRGGKRCRIVHALASRATRGADRVTVQKIQPER